jgi:hypothetical protein
LGRIGEEIRGVKGYQFTLGGLCLGVSLSRTLE